MGMQRDKWHEMLRKDENLEKRLKRDIKKLMQQCGTEREVEGGSTNVNGQEQQNIMNTKR